MTTRTGLAATSRTVRTEASTDLLGARAVPARGAHAERWMRLFELPAAPRRGWGSPFGSRARDETAGLEKLRLADVRDVTEFHGEPTGLRPKVR